MSDITGTYIAARASELAQDTLNVTWLTAQILEWINDAQHAIAVVRPDVSVSTAAVQLVSGTKQTITGRRVMSVIRNMGADGATPGRAIRLVERGVKDEFDPDWHTATVAVAVKEYMYDVRNPKEYYVSPPVSAVTNVYVELAQATNPTALTALSDTIGLDDAYVPVIIEWVMYRIFGRESEQTPSYARAARHFVAFFNMLGEKLKIDLAVNPQVRAHLSSG